MLNPPSPNPNLYRRSPYKQSRRTCPQTSPNHHNHSSSFYRSGQSPPSMAAALPTQILNFEHQKHKCMRMKQYARAERLDRKIKRARSEMASSRVNQLLDNQRSQRRSISEAHKGQIKYFQKSWSRYFYQLQERQSLILQCFKEEQEKEVVQAQLRVRRRCRSLHIPRAQIHELRKKEYYLKKREDFAYLKLVKSQLAEAAIRERRERAKAMEKFAELEEERLSIIQSKKYSVLVRRLEEYRQDKEKVYLREQKRLRQKYRNVIQQLEHEQTMEFEETNQLALAMEQ